MRSLVAVALALALGPATSAAAFEAGLAARDLTPPVGVPLAGFFARRAAFPDLFGQHPYAHYFEPSTGVRQTASGAPDAIRAKALFVREGAESLLFVSLDLVGIPRGLRADVLASIDARNLGIPHDRVLLSATHTHSGPGALSDVWLFEKTATDRFHAGIHAAFVKGVADTVEEAVAAVVPAKLRSVSYTVADVQENRRKDGAFVDDEAHLLLVRTANESKHLGALVNFAVHGTVFGHEHRLLSADFPGAIEREVGALLASVDGDPPGSTRPVLFVNAAEGDVQPKGKHLAGLSAKFRSATAAALAAGPLHDLGAGISVAPPRTIDLGAPLFYYESNAPGWLRPLLSSRTGLWLGLVAFPSDATIWSVKLGDLRLMTWPGEPTAALGRCLREAAVAAGAREGWIFALTNDHLAYFTTPEEFSAAADIASKNSVYGPHAGSKIVSEHCALMQGP